MTGSMRALLGETLRVDVYNSGAVKHEPVRAISTEMKELRAMMVNLSGMEHADADMVRAAPGKTGEVVCCFDKVGKLDFSWLPPRHYDAGMVGSLKRCGRPAPRRPVVVAVAGNKC